MKNRLVLGDYNVICDECGRKFKRSETRLRWDNALVCPRDWEPRHPLDFIQPGRTTRPVLDARPQTENTFVNPGDVTRDDL